VFDVFHQLVFGKGLGEKPPNCCARGIASPTRTSGAGFSISSKQWENQAGRLTDKMLGAFWLALNLHPGL
jgi:hypothetical protein